MADGDKQVLAEGIQVRVPRELEREEARCRHGKRPVGVVSDHHHLSIGWSKHKQAAWDGRRHLRAAQRKNLHTRTHTVRAACGALNGDYRKKVRACAQKNA